MKENNRDNLRETKSWGFNFKLDKNPYQCNDNYETRVLKAELDDLRVRNADLEVT